MEIQIDRDTYEVDINAVMTGAEILAMAGKKPENWTLNAKYFDTGRRREVFADCRETLFNPWIQRYETAAKQALQG